MAVQDRRADAAGIGAWSTVSNGFRQWRDAGVFEALLEGLIAEAAKRGEGDLSLVTIDSTTIRAHQDATGMDTSQDVLTALEKAAAEEEEARSKGAVPRDEAGRTVVPIPIGTSGDASGAGAGSGC
ncbi:Transposase [Streptomyces leeuwenhoekii]|uniref:Transposase n=1 Tax=Streptomyces leeuwenhoekii TaxID=1437453 RepID=A0A0F7VZ45_STRLW|nr:hypothetical protein [Streptomyces leeuwenhoekii]CQR65804.1 Transposase [Streptomyces leeuwenhoekii]